MRVELATQRANILGEGPLWHAGRARLYWVDIRSRRIEWLEPQSGAAGRHETPVRASALAVRAAGGLLLAGDRCIGVLDLETGAFEQRLSFEAGKPNNRSNDGAMGADGRFWFGTMDDAAAPRQGALYALSSDWRLQCLREGLSIPNGIAIAANGRTLYLADSLDQTISTHAIGADGALGPPARFFSAHGKAATPDGAALDAEGFLWSAQWDGACLLRLAPDGAVAAKVDMPVSRPTACAFGGPDLNTLYITSAREGLSPAELARQPLAGSVFKLAAPAPGLPRPAFAG